MLTEIWKLYGWCQRHFLRRWMHHWENPERYANLTAVEANSNSSSSDFSFTYCTCKNRSPTTPRNFNVCAPASIWGEISEGEEGGQLQRDPRLLVWKRMEEEMWFSNPHHVSSRLRNFDLPRHVEDLIWIYLSVNFVYLEFCCARFFFTPTKFVAFTVFIFHACIKQNVQLREYQRGRKSGNKVTAKIKLIFLCQKIEILLEEVP